jgi:hypothetical protein
VAFVRDNNLFVKDLLNSSKYTPILLWINDFFSIYRFLLEFNQKLFAEISPIIQQIFDEFNPKPLESIVNMCYPYSHYLKKVEIAYERTSTINLKVYDKYTMHKIYDMLCSSVFQAQ